MTLDDTQAARLLASVAVAATVAVGADKVRETILSKEVGSTTTRLAEASEAK